MKLRTLFAPLITNKHLFARGADRRFRFRNLTFGLAGLVLPLALLASCATRENPSEASKQTEKGVSGQPSEADMAAMMELAKPGENHKLLSRGVGDWDYKVKMWMNGDPSTTPQESSGTATTKAIMDGRYFFSEHTGKMQMPGPDGKMTDMEFKGMSIEGYDNVKKKFVASWVDNMGTGIMNLEGTYDANAKAFTYRAEFEMMPGMKMKVKEVIKITDNDHHTFEWYEDRGGQEVKTMEIAYTRKA